MTIVIESAKKAERTEVKLAPISADTTVTLERKSRYTFIYENDEIIDALPVYYPIMKIVRSIRRAVPTAKLELI